MKPAPPVIKIFMILNISRSQPKLFLLFRIIRQYLIIYLNDQIGGLMTSDVNGTVIAIQGNAVSSTAPTSSQILKWDGTQWSPSLIADASISSSAAIAGSK